MSPRESLSLAADTIIPHFPRVRRSSVVPARRGAVAVEVSERPPMRPEPPRGLKMLSADARPALRPERSRLNPSVLPGAGAPAAPLLAHML